MDNSVFNRPGPLKWTAITLGLSVFVFLYMPLMVLFVYSFSEARVMTFPPQGLSLRWYQALAQNTELLQSVGNSLKVAAGVVPLTLLIGVPAAYALVRLSFRGSSVLAQMFSLPLMIPGLVTGLSILLLLKGMGLGLSLWAVVFGHTIAFLPIVIGQVMARLQRLDMTIEEASLDLGASHAGTFIKIVLPNLGGAIIGSALLVFTLSIDEVAITFLLTGTQNTLPMHIWAMLRQGVTPEICAVATLTVLASTLLIVVGIRLSRK
jgi:spermidine/putrescine transport system permease protein